MAKQEHTLMTADEVVDAYMEGRRHFHYVILDGAQFGGVNLRAASFYGASLRECHFERALLSQVQFKQADLTGAFMADAALNATDLIGANFSKANLSHADLTGAALNYANCTRTDMRNVTLGNSRLSGADLEGARFGGSSLSSTNFGDTDVSALCDAKKLRHDGPSSIDPRTVIRSYHHPEFKRFMQDCGVPGLFADYMIDCAHALGEPLLRTLMQSTFISYGGPDEAFARKLYEALRKHGVTVFFFPESATWGERIDSEVYRRLQEHDRVILICSRSSLDRSGVLNEIQETFDRESKDGGATYLLPVMIDEYVLREWRTNPPELAERVRRRVVGDFRKARRNRAAFDSALDRLLDALKTKRPSL